MAMKAETIAELERVVTAAAAESDGGVHGVFETMVAGVLLAISIQGDDVADFLARAITLAARDAGGIDQLLRASAAGPDFERVRALCRGCGTAWPGEDGPWDSADDD